MLKWHRDHARSFPWRESREAYPVLIGELLLQRTRAENVLPVYQEFIRRWPSPEELAGARVQSIQSVIRPLGLTSKAETLKSLGVALKKAGGTVPTEPDTLAQLPGVGPYVAHGVPIFAEGRDLPLVDWVIARVLRRYLGMPGVARPNADRELWQAAEKLARRGQSRTLWLGTLDFAAAICRPRPLCHQCPIALTCAFATARANG